MGGDLPPQHQRDRSPRFAVLAMRETDFDNIVGTPLQRIQIIKGWLNQDGEPVHKIFEVAGDPDNGVKPGTAFEDLPDDWTCPDCGVGKEEFEPVED